MTMIADIAIFQCDHCGKYAACRDDASWTQFEADWHEGVTRHYCPACRIIPDIAAAILSDDVRFKQAIKEFSNAQRTAF
ncbi:MAG: hypothetical protein IT173_12080 [Acidobacteria bacterium]|nr:hypothetical protein [Acidobacteriota bacterium]